MISRVLATCARAGHANWRRRSASLQCLCLFFFFKQKTAYDILASLEFRRVLFRSAWRGLTLGWRDHGLRRARTGRSGVPDRKSVVWGKSVDLGSRRIIKKKKKL